MPMRPVCRESGRATSVLLLMILSSGCALDVAGIKLDIPPDPEPIAYTCSCSCSGDPLNVNPVFNVCVPDTLNKNKPGGQEASLAAIEADCLARVVPNYTDTLFACLGRGLKDVTIVFPKDCRCTVQPATSVAECNGTCAVEAVDCAAVDPRSAASLKGSVPPGTTNAEPVCEVAPGSAA